jgi:hypothetical protein
MSFLGFAWGCLSPIRCYLLCCFLLQGLPIPFLTLLWGETMILWLPPSYILGCCLLSVLLSVVAPGHNLPRKQTLSVIMASYKKETLISRAVENRFCFPEKLLRNTRRILCKKRWRRKRFTLWLNLRTQNHCWRRTIFSNPNSRQKKNSMVIFKCKASYNCKPVMTLTPT